MNIEFLDRLNDVFLEVEVNPKGAARFEEQYRDITGEIPTLGNGYQHQPNKWGREVRVYFNSTADLEDDFTSIDVHVEQGNRPYRDEWQYRTNSFEFFWELVRLGYRLGQN